MYLLVKIMASKLLQDTQTCWTLMPWWCVYHCSFIQVWAELEVLWVQLLKPQTKNYYRNTFISHYLLCYYFTFNQDVQCSMFLYTYSRIQSESWTDGGKKRERNEKCLQVLILHLNFLSVFMIMYFYVDTPICRNWLCSEVACAVN